MNNEEKILAILESMQAEQQKTNERLGGLETRFDKLETRFDTLETRFDKLEARFDTLETGFNELKAKVDRLEVGLSEVKKDTEAIFEHVVGLTEAQVATDKTVADLTAVVKENTFDIVKLKAARQCRYGA